MFTYGSICSGIEAASVAWQGLGKPLWFAEIEPFPSALLAYRYPEIPNLGDMTALPEKILNREIKAPDVLVGGTPCQAFSVAGKRESLDDERGNLTLALIHILEAIDYVRNQNGQPPCVLVWENVQGVLSTKDNAFGHFLAGLAQECQPLQPSGARWTNSGYVHSARTICWRVLNAQYFGVAQRRKRVFLVASARRRRGCANCR
nr:DNA cytosine methyltransferase [Histophilus somni]